MTLDAVAQKSGVSKGGLIYNFPTKEALLDGMLTRMFHRINELRQTIRSEQPADQPNELVVEIRTLQGKSRHTDQRLSAALLAAVANQPELLTPIRAQLSQRFACMIPPQGNFLWSAILFFAAFGIHFHDMMNVSLLDPRQKAELYDELCRLAAPDACP